MNKAVFWLSLLSATSFSVVTQADPKKFYANPTLQAENPSAYAVSDVNQAWLEQAHKKREQDAKAVFEALKANTELFKQLQAWETLSFEERMALLPQVFEIECRTMGITPPELVINNTLYPKRAVNFVFDVRSPGSGLVYLNPKLLKEMDVYAPLAFLLHETRHAYQFQLAYSETSILAQGYKSAFETQSNLKGASFSDFLTLLNEYEAFQFGNHVLELLTDGTFESPMMGTFASQFGNAGQLKIDLVKLHERKENSSLLEKYNRAANVQYKLRYPNQ
ncbi:hypothetical protein ACFSJY_11925 [Thalassotalea euphylliae]|uniref:hypothetical protein n=1 Tax=Thalassotalea euphylliae TaxID=1655234 RepID=UPI00363881E4